MDYEDYESYSPRNPHVDLVILVFLVILSGKKVRSTYCLHSPSYSPFSHVKASV